MAMVAATMSPTPMLQESISKRAILRSIVEFNDRWASREQGSHNADLQWSRRLQQLLPCPGQFRYSRHGFRCCAQLPYPDAGFGNAIQNRRKGISQTR